MIDTAEAPAAGPGHNLPPLPTPESAEPWGPKVQEFTNAARVWAELKVIEDDEKSEKLADFITGIRGLRKKVEDARKDAKKPWDDGAAAVQGAFKPMVDRLDAAGKHLQKMQSDYLVKKQAELERQQAEERKRAEELRRQTEEAAKATEDTFDPDAEAEAERLAKEAKAAEKASSKPARAQSKSASGAGRTMSMRTTWEPEITNIRAAFMAFQDHPEVAETLTRLAAQRARSAEFDPETETIPGFTLHKRQFAI
ncbi:hypothetical protein [Sediminimonas sp.]|uniref:hypothetical protein n=1 Tax=Sediminimonas sp. TaxID=2823379 RepID=UPI0025DE107C|nr:hypothetical protein [Sediminimonas sp.]